MNADNACAQSREKRPDCLGEGYMKEGSLKVNESPRKPAMHSENYLIFQWLQEARARPCRSG